MYIWGRCADDDFFFRRLESDGGKLKVKMMWENFRWLFGVLNENMTIISSVV